MSEFPLDRHASQLLPAPEFCHETGTPTCQRVTAVRVRALLDACIPLALVTFEGSFLPSADYIADVSYKSTISPPCPPLTASSASSLESEVSILGTPCPSALSNPLPVDYFRNVVNDPPLACFLSHIHSDHLAGLDTFRGRLVYCSPATRAMLLKLQRKASRINFAQRILEAEEITYKHQRNRLVSSPSPSPLTRPIVRS